MTTTTHEPTRALAITREVFGDERIEVLKEQLGRGWREPMTDAELEHIALVCQETRLNPLVKPPLIYFIKRYDSKAKREVMTPQVSIDGLRLIAQRSRDYGGQIGPLWTADGKDWTDVWLSEEPPRAAKVGVLRRGFKEPTWAVATWQEWAQWQDEYDRSGNKTGRKTLSPFWAAKPAHMLGKTAEGMAIKRAFAQETNKLELAAMHEEFVAMAPAMAKRYEEIFGGDEERSAYELPPAYRTNASGQTIDAISGEVLEDDDDTEQQPAPTPGEVRSAAWVRNRELVAEAQKRGITGGIPTLNNRSATDAVTQANEALEERIRNHDLDQQAQRDSEQLL